jgi:hypothetical protein
MTPEQKAAICEAVARAMHPDDWQCLSRNARCNAMLTAGAAVSAHLKALEAAGYAVVPVEPTFEMLRAAATDEGANPWLAMIEARPR